MEFDVAGPFDISRHGTKKQITVESLKELKPVLEDWQRGLSSAIGCYVFAIRAGRGFKPWYVGQSCKRALPDEALNPSNREKYNTIINEQKGTPTLFLVPMHTPGKKFRKKKIAGGGLQALDFLERWLIATCIERNPELVNNKLTKFMRTIHVVGVFNANRGEAHDSAQKLRRTLWRRGSL